MHITCILYIYISYKCANIRSLSQTPKVPLIILIKLYKKFRGEHKAPQNSASSSLHITSILYIYISHKCANIRNLPQTRKIPLVTLIKSYKKFRGAHKAPQNSASSSLHITCILYIYISHKCANIRSLPQTRKIPLVTLIKSYKKYRGAHEAPENSASSSLHITCILYIYISYKCANVRSLPQTRKVPLVTLIQLCEKSHAPKESPQHFSPSDQPNRSYRKNQTYLKEFFKRTKQQREKRKEDRRWRKETWWSMKNPNSPHY